MPANKNYLTQSPFQRFLKILSGFVGGYFITELFFMLLVLWFNASAMLFTLRFAGFLLWAALMICAFLFKSGWRALLVFSLSTLALATLLYFNLPLEA
ncbi:hypothetical protein LAG90_00490 [Marinilongibacter aquaticus]|uniref:hypothetical protein n=1 Tax=Marinilongibacter aquaticus TaxID=2975157 RepID=UPI0021BDD48D|nr:hypothetical protein [Marinilongibacter aquaticus]UBM59136.1 hypothetical protein LAG90_00490 [Marinilongibacter aquaticus]